MGEHPEESEETTPPTSENERIYADYHECVSAYIKRQERDLEDLGADTSLDFECPTNSTIAEQLTTDDMRLILYLKHKHCYRATCFDDPEYDARLKKYRDMDEESDLMGMIIPPLNIFDLIYLASRDMVIEFTKFATAGHITYDSYPLEFMRGELTRHIYNPCMDFYLEAICARHPREFVGIYISMLQRCDHTPKTVIASRYAQGRDILEILARTRDEKIMIDAGSFNYMIWKAPAVLAELRAQGEQIPPRLDPFIDENDNREILD